MRPTSVDGAVASSPAPGRPGRRLDPNRGWVLPGLEPPITATPSGGDELPRWAMVRASVVLVASAGTTATETDERVRDLASLLGRRDEIVVVDATGGGTGTPGDAAADQRVRPVRCVGKRPWGWAANLGLQHAWGRMVAVASVHAAPAEVLAGLDALVHLGRLAVAVASEPAGRATGAIPPPPVVVAGWREGLVDRVGPLDDTATDALAEWWARSRRALVAGAWARVVSIEPADAEGARWRTDAAGHETPGDDPVPVLAWPRRDEPVTVTLASIPQRRDHLRRVVSTLLPQADRVCVWLNGYDDVPDVLRHPRVVVRRSQDGGDLRDNGKFAFDDVVADGHHLLVDDDIDYPDDYVDRMVAKVEQYGRRAVVGVHGVIVDVPVVGYFDHREVFHFGTALRRDRIVNVLGSGTVAMHTSTLRMTVADCPRTGMADIWLAVAAHRRGVPLVAVARPTRHLMQLEIADRSLFQEYRHDDEPHVEALAGVDLRLRDPFDDHVTGPRPGAA